MYFPGLNPEKSLGFIPKVLSVATFDLVVVPDGFGAGVLFPDDVVPPVFPPEFPPVFPPVLVEPPVFSFPFTVIVTYLLPVTSL